MRQKKLIIGLLVMLALVTSGFTYAYWYTVTGSNADTTGEVTVGTGKSFTTSVTVGSETGSSLVPSGMAAYSNEVDATDSLELTFQVSWDEVSTSALTSETGSIAVTVTNVQLDSSTTLAATYVTVTPGTAPSVTVNGAAVDVIITVTLGTPADATAYALIAGKTITFDVNFAVTLS